MTSDLIMNGEGREQLIKLEEGEQGSVSIFISVSLSPCSLIAHSRKTQ